MMNKREAPTSQGGAEKKEKVTLIEQQERPSWIEINLQNFASNWKNIQSIVGEDTKIIAMVKANGYGHGAIEIARKAQDLGASYAGVVSVGETRELREAGITMPILIVNRVDPDGVREAIKLDATITVMDMDVLEALNKTAEDQKKKAKVHVHIDTGMHREGALPNDAMAIITHISNYPNVEFEGVLTHFATADEEDLSFAYQQLSVFNDCLDRIEAYGISLPPFIHAANSGAILQMPETHIRDPNKRFTAVRPGISLYGFPAVPPNTPSPIELRPVLSVKAKLVGIKTIPSGETVGYGRTYTAESETKLGLVPFGYADGLPRSLSNKGDILVGGRRAPIVGRISMDQTIIKLPDNENLALGDEVVIIGRQGDEEITAEDIARSTGTIVNDIVAGLHAKRLPKIIVEEK